MIAKRCGRDNTSLNKMWFIRQKMCNNDTVFFYHLLQHWHHSRTCKITVNMENENFLKNITYALSYLLIFTYLWWYCMVYCLSWWWLLNNPLSEQQSFHSELQVLHQPSLDYNDWPRMFVNSIWEHTSTTLRDVDAVTTAQVVIHQTDSWIHQLK